MTNPGKEYFRHTVVVRPKEPTEIMGPQPAAITLNPPVQPVIDFGGGHEIWRESPSSVCIGGSFLRGRYCFHTDYAASSRQEQVRAYVVLAEA